MCLLAADRTASAIDQCEIDVDLFPISDVATLNEPSFRFCDLPESFFARTAYPIILQRISRITCRRFLTGQSGHDLVSRKFRADRHKATLYQTPNAVKFLAMVVATQVMG